MNEITPHYTGENGIECIEAIEAMGQLEGFCKGNIVKYLWRAGRKEGDASYLQDLVKARHYLDHYIKYVQNKLEVR